MEGIDCASPVGHLAPRLFAAGIGFVGRYYSHNPDDNPKNLSPEEARALAAAGINIVSVFEARGDRAENFTAAQGALDAARALELAGRCGQTAASTIYFAVDFDASSADVASRILPYFAAIKQGLGGRYATGGYGSGFVLAELRAAGLIGHCWLAQARGWRGTANFADADIVQGPSSTMFNVAVDLDASRNNDFGAWIIPGGISGDPPIGPVISAIPSARDLQTALAAAGCDPGAVDGIWGPRSAAALAAYYRQA